MKNRDHRPLGSRLATATAIASLASACGMGLPLEQRIISTRPLGIRVEIDDPMRPATDPVRAEGLPLELARLVPLFVDPQGPLTPEAIESTLEPIWLYCALGPNEGLFACLSGKLPLRPADVLDCPPVDIDPTNLDPTSIPAPPSPCRITGGTPAQPEFTIPLDPAFLIGGDIEVTMVAHAPGSSVSTDLCLERLLDQSNDIPEACLFVSQRVPVGPDGRLLELAASLGFALPGLPPIPDPIPDPDRHPRIQSFTARVRGENEQEVGVYPLLAGDTITVAAGHVIELETIAPEEDLQTYVIPVDMSSYEEREEAYEGRWFRTWGDLLSGASDDPVSLNTWTMVPGEQDEDELPAGGIATMYYVLRDGRNGMDWFWFSVEVSP